jgi:hypothetical protein
MSSAYFESDFLVAFIRKSAFFMQTFRQAGNSDNQGKSQNNHDIEGPDDDSMDLNRARQLLN